MSHPVSTWMGDHLGIPGAVDFSSIHSARHGYYGKNPWTMTDNINTQPSVPSNSRGTTHGSGRTGNGAEDAKNLWVWTHRHLNLRNGTYSARTLSSDVNMIELEDELFRIKFNVDGNMQGIMEGRRMQHTLSNSAHSLYYKSGNIHHNGVTFVVHKVIVGNAISFIGMSDRVAQLTIKIKVRYQLNLIAAHLSTSYYMDTDEEVEMVYEDIDSLYTGSKAHYKIIMGDFNV